MLPAAVSTLDGYLLINKPSGPTSYDMIRWVKRASNKAKIGHTGTLDPIAEGLMILLFGKATKKQAGLMGQDKTYTATIKLGIKTDSADITGKIIEEKSVPSLGEAQIRATLAGFLGERKQTPPMYSALKVQGTPLYKLARKGETVVRTERSITIRSMEFLEHTAQNEIRFKVRCSSGTYVRTLAEDIGAALGTVATMTYLRRDEIGVFGLASAVPGSALKDFTYDRLCEHVKPLG